ncbi:1250_t:CDS:10 [Paraglomus brasilianum]|uniref:1250_t:CDS:1 n=1 Tax=Paraglomus brasilianum TaxID=144538 RepID=A0A9N8Z0R2_9GLOM|nr:1250_t:CDS:10 [Paraglomus brasilianum]
MATDTSHGTKRRNSASIESEGAVSIKDSEHLFQEINDRLSVRLHDLVQTDFFKYYKLNLFKECPFWIENGQCVNEACAVETIDESNVPEMWRSNVLGALQTSASGSLFQPFKSCEFREQDFCVVEDENDRDGTYVDLLDNPERFTGYAGPSAGRIWKSIYEENCFNMVDRMDSKSNLPGMTLVNLDKYAALRPNIQDQIEIEVDDTCFEKRVYYRLISGLHSSISIHICNEYLNQTTGVWGPNYDCFNKRIVPYPERLQNTYFGYVVLLRAISKMSDYLKNYEFCTGHTEQDAQVKSMVTDLVNTATSCPGTFDEKLMFSSPNSRILKEEFKERFRNVSRIMDCVGCDKCRLWGKLQVSGLGTALKVLFSYDDEFFNPKVNPNLLTRTEIVALFNAFNRFSESLKIVKEFRELYKRVNVNSQKSVPPPPQPVSSPKLATSANASQDPSSDNQFVINLILSLRDMISPYIKRLSGLFSVS